MKTDYSFFRFIKQQWESKLLIAMLLMAVAFVPSKAFAQIWEPEGLNLPGQWNDWQNPPVNNLALASATQIPGGRVTKLNNGIVRWQTIFSVAETGADLTGGTYNWLFSSGPESNPWGNKWAGVNVVHDQLQNYTYNSGADNAVTLSNGKWYAMNWEDAGYAASRAIFMELSAEPSQIISVSVPESVTANEPATIIVNLDRQPAAEEVFYIQYTINNWASAELVTVSINGSSGSATIPGQAEGVTVKYLAFSSTVTNIPADYELYSIKFNDNNGIGYTYTVEGVFVSFISWANLQWPGSGQIQPGQDFLVYARVYAEGITDGVGQGEGIQAWIGYSDTNTDPDGWGNWFPATYNADAGTQDEYVFNLGPEIMTEGTFYYASAFGLFDQAKVRGGFSSTGGGFWDGINNVSGTLTVSSAPTSWPVTFTVIDGTSTLENVKLKGEMTNWDTIQMIQNGNEWQLTLMLSAGSYEWGAIEADGSEWGIWLIEGPNLLVEVDAEGNVSGDTTYTTYVTQLQENTDLHLRVYPNPAHQWLYFDWMNNPASLIKVYSIRGQLLLEANASSGKLDVSDLSEGLYIIEAAIAGNTIRKKIMIHHSF